MGDRDIAQLVRDLAEAHGIHDEARVGAAHRLLHSQLTPNEALGSENTLVLSTIRRLMGDSRSPEASRFAKLAAELALDPGVPGESPWPILYVLSSLTNAGSPSNPVPRPGVEQGNDAPGPVADPSSRPFGVFGAPRSVPE